MDLWTFVIRGVEVQNVLSGIALCVSPTHSKHQKKWFFFMWLFTKNRDWPRTKAYYNWYITRWRSDAQTRFIVEDAYSLSNINYMRTFTSTTTKFSLAVVHLWQQFPCFLLCWAERGSVKSQRQTQLQPGTTYNSQERTRTPGHRHKQTTYFIRL